MTLDPRQKTIPNSLQFLIGLCILGLLILTPILLVGHPAGPVTAPLANGTVHVKILAVNDFHGHLPPGQTMNNRTVGGAPVLASYLKSAITSEKADGTIIAIPGDVYGNSPPESGLLLDEPTMLFFNSFADQNTTTLSSSPNSSGNMIATLGNQDFDRGVPELMREINGGNGTTNITHLVDPYPGSRSTYVSANVVWKANNTTILPPYTIRNVSGVPIAFIGADTITTPGLQEAANVKDVTFLDEADSINRYIPEIQQQGVHAIVVLLHEGGNQTPYDGPTRGNGTVTGRVATIIPRLDSDVDVVLSAHTHQFTNTYLNNSGNKPVLVTQAYMFGMGFADVDLTIDRAGGDITNKSARIITTYADQAPGTSPDPAAAALLAADEKAVAPMVKQVIGVAAQNITRDQNPAGESALGDLIADELRGTMEADIGFESAGSIRADITQGNISWGDLYAVQPSSGTVLSMTLTGDQIRQVLEQQWQEPLPPHNLMVSGLVYTYDTTRPAGNRVTEVKVHDRPLDLNATYTVATVDYLLSGGDGYTTFTQGKDVTFVLKDIDALTAYIGSSPQPVNVTIDGRIQRIH
ncbi:bifunctional metallophosphatase/5'-nucleotidase [Methanosphaerula palustris]|uniref:5'-Nucleotidase domain protein n=1 Tax=Methanosphaerula palustris (strain ATCC BAA-1556 / DSM 19958 / E1-9c) TaxID=521011 RepID=B8GGH8_METPE|nr:bifunctional metallophosphatase/5'-nucleotidase [Methanosphaerula palustris]ACL16233.1 5'-Nucleotidase domain protein [Methanosphaerula palustris E1-9c]